MLSRGSSGNVESTRKMLKSHWDKDVILKHITLTGGKLWEEEWDPLNKELWQQVAGFLIHNYTFESTVPGSSTKIQMNLSPTVAKNYFIGLVHLAKTERFAANAEAQKFFQCTVDAAPGALRSTDQTWYFGLKTQVWNTTYDRAAKEGEVTDKLTTAPNLFTLKRANVLRCNTPMRTLRIRHL